MWIRTVLVINVTIDVCKSNYANLIHMASYDDIFDIGINLILIIHFFKCSRERERVGLM